MNTGKVSNEFLKNRIFSKLQIKRKDVLLGPGIGRDCSVLEFGDELCIISSDPITGAVSRIGYIGVHICCNDIATTGAEVIGVTLTILAPPSTAMSEIEQAVIDAEYAARELGIDILGGHTEITDSVTKMVICLTAVGKVSRQNLVSFTNAKAGDDIVITKKAGMEGTAILAHDREDLLKRYLPEDIIKNAQSYMGNISVLKEGRIASDFGVHGMHDATEGGILGAIWETSEAMGKGVEIQIAKIPVAPETKAICSFFNIDPLKLISSGCMVIVSPNGPALVEALNDNGIEAAVIGKVIDVKDKWLITEKGRVEIMPPEADHLYKALQYEKNT
ncbi:MAG: AIR synthase [Clostridiales bacterium]|nr:AIR synthase [Clostridiales bacterium]